MNSFQRMNFEHQQRLAPIHEAGHVIAARYCQIKVVSTNIFAEPSGKCGNTQIERITSDYSRVTGLPIDKKGTFTTFTRHNFKLLAGPAAQAKYCFDNQINTIQDFAAIEPKIWGILLELPQNDDSFQLEENTLPHGMALLLNELGASGDWQNILSNFKNLPYDYYEELISHEMRTNYLRTLWSGTLDLLEQQWNDVEKIAEMLIVKQELTGEDIDQLLA